MTMKKRLSIKSTWTKRYKTIEKEFTNQKHFSNYISFMESKGYKTIGIWNIE